MDKQVPKKNSGVEEKNWVFCLSEWSRINLHYGTPYLWPTNSFPLLIHFISESLGTMFVTMLSAYQILVISIENTFNNYFRFSAGLLIWFYVCNIIPRKGNNCISSIIIFGHINWLIWRSFFFLLRRKFLFFIQFIFVFCCVIVKFQFFN